MSKFTFKKLERELYLACMFAKQMQEEGEYGGLANYKAGRYYGYTASEVAQARNYLKEQYKHNEMG